MSLEDIGCNADIPETGDTLQDNAYQKAAYVFEHYGLSCFADDTGLEVDALDGAPGVHSARYAEGTHHDSEANMERLLRELGNNNNRKARFRTVIALIEKKEQTDSAHSDMPHRGYDLHYFEGQVDGTIATEKSGKQGFGYDPLFVPDGYDKSFAELGTDIKNQISHRARAVLKLSQYLKDTKQTDM